MNYPSGWTKSPSIPVSLAQFDELARLQREIALKFTKITSR
jgi:hypothetical protein